MNERDFDNMTEVGFFMLQQMIQDKVSPDEIMTILAEECNELAHAALKFRRAFRNENGENDNPTPVTGTEALKAVYEEIADIGICLEVLEMLGKDDIKMLKKMMLEKGLRWAERLGEADGK